MLRKQTFYQKHIWPNWIRQIQQSENRTMFLHGIMGSELYDRTSDDEVWVDTGLWHEVDNLEFESLSPDGAKDGQDQFIYARQTVRIPVIEDPYDNLRSHIDLGHFCFDWRDSVHIEATRLESFLALLLADEKPINIITHSMGGCVLLHLLGRNRSFDHLINRIIFCAPPFRGALKPLRVIEIGNGTPADWMIRNNRLKESVASMPGLFQMMVAPKEFWQIRLPTNNADIQLNYPIAGDIDIYNLDGLTNRYRPNLRSQILDFASRYHQSQKQHINTVVRIFGNRIHVIVGLNGKTAYTAIKANGTWSIPKLPEAPNGQKSNGDGTVLFQSSFMPGLDLDRYAAFIPNSQEDTHGSLVDYDPVIAGIEAILTDDDPHQNGLVDYPNFIDQIDWSHEIPQAEQPNRFTNLDYIDRSMQRERLPRNRWGRSLNPERTDAIRFYETRQAAIRVIYGEDLKANAQQIGESEEFIKIHIRDMLLPLS